MFDIISLFFFRPLLLFFHIIRILPSCVISVSKCLYSFTSPILLKLFINFELNVCNLPKNSKFKCNLTRHRGYGCTMVSAFTFAVHVSRLKPNGSNTTVQEKQDIEQRTVQVSLFQLYFYIRATYFLDTRTYCIISVNFEQVNFSRSYFGKHYTLRYL